MLSHFRSFVVCRFTYLISFRSRFCLFWRIWFSRSLWNLCVTFVRILRIELAFLLSWRDFAIHSDFSSYASSSWRAFRVIITFSLMHIGPKFFTISFNFLFTFCQTLFSQLLQKSFAFCWWYHDSLFLLWWATKESLVDLFTFNISSWLIFWAWLGSLKYCITLSLLWLFWFFLLFADPWWVCCQNLGKLGLHVLCSNIGRLGLAYNYRFRITLFRAWEQIWCLNLKLFPIIVSSLRSMLYGESLLSLIIFKRTILRLRSWILIFDVFLFLLFLFLFKFVILTQVALNCNVERFLLGVRIRFLWRLTCYFDTREHFDIVLVSLIVSLLIDHIGWNCQRIVWVLLTFGFVLSNLG